MENIQNQTEQQILDKLGDFGNEECYYCKDTPYEEVIKVCVNKAIEIVKKTYKEAEKTDHEQSSMMTISTAHITPEMAEAMKDGEFMDGEIGIPCYEKSDYGFFIPITEDYTPENPILSQLFDYAKANNCQWLCLDSDGPEVEMLPTYDWDRDSMELE